MLSLQHLLSRIDLFSGLLGLLAGGLTTALLLLAGNGRLRRKQLMNTMRLEAMSSSLSDQAETIDRLRRERDGFRRDWGLLNRENAGLQAGYEGMEQQLAERELILTQVQRQLEQRFELLAGEILTEKSALINQQHESTLKLMLDPFHSQLHAFKQRIDQIHDLESRDRVSVIQELQNLRQLNQRLSADAVNLTQALQGRTKLQGQWGEMILEKLLEDSGLRKGVEYRTQVNLQTAAGNKRQPDAIVYLPEEREIIIDAKVSLKAFSLAHGEEEGERRQRFIGQHLDSVKKHISLLSDKQYHQLAGLNSVDFVLLFIPVEAAFQLAMERDHSLLATASRRQIILCSPSTLLATLRTINYLWRQEEQSRNGLMIAKQAGNIYDKLVGFIATFEEIGSRINQSQQAWQLAKKRLTSGKGNLIRRAEQLKELGVQTDKDLAAVLKESPTDTGDLK
ncbi:DNA recombination protein RmuC [Desulfogranum mediterraneum]|uniref:DNA recombination protein RmuC n=1 Tax=Desulfogranum mediterraneum TaxID=160661 RepID=UPI00040A9492|nr:DNA recombination protein RmuC [Desulfogranum mediterraneum]